MSKMEIKGMKEFQNRLKQMEKAAKELDGTHEVPFSELFTDSFMTRYTDFKSFEDFMVAGGFHAETTENLKRSLTSFLILMFPQPQNFHLGKKCLKPLLLSM